MTEKQTQNKTTHKITFYLSDNINITLEVIDLDSFLSKIYKNYNKWIFRRKTISIGTSEKTLTIIPAEKILFISIEKLNVE